MFNFEVNTKDLNRFKEYNTRLLNKNIASANDDIRRDWAYELDRQQRSFHRSSVWPPLSPEYDARKRREHAQPGSEVKYVSTLRRTGKMLSGYIEGINPVRNAGISGIEILFPAGDAGVRAKAHQGATGRPLGVPLRPFKVEAFQEIAVERYNKAIKDSLKK